MNKLNEISLLLQGDFEGHVVWDDVLSVKPTPHQEICRLYGAAGNISGDVKLMDNNGDWYPLEPTDRHFDYVANSVLQRLKLLKVT